MVLVRCRRMLCATALGEYPDREIALRTRSWISVATVLLPFITRDTVAMETPAKRATSVIVISCFMVNEHMFGQYPALGSSVCGFAGCGRSNSFSSVD